MTVNMESDSAEKPLINASSADNSAHVLVPPVDDHLLDVEYEQPEITQPASIIAREIIETLLLTLLIFWVVNTMTGRFRIEGSSMQPTMHEGQYVLINKMSYFLEEPNRGDIVVLHFPRDPSRDFIKRVIGLPGDNVNVAGGFVTVNGVQLSEPYISAPPNYTDSWIVPQDQFFVLGDNRNNSHDSHSFGFVPREQLVGKGWVVYWPISSMSRVPHNPHLAVPDN